MVYYPWPSFVDPMQLFTYVNTLTDGWFGALMPALPLVSLQSSFMLLGNSFSKSLPSASFLGFVSALLLRAVGMVGDVTVLVYLSFFIVAVIIVRIEKTV